MNKDINDVLKMQQDDMKKLNSDLAEQVEKSAEENDEEKARLAEFDKKKEEILRSLKGQGISIDKELEEADAAADKETEQLLNEINKNNRIAEEKSITYDDLVALAHSRGYENTKIQDLLTEEEIRVADERFNKIEAEFEEKTKLTKMDMAFLATAVALQAVRQYVITPFSNRSTADEGSKIMEDRYGNEGRLTGRYYYATEESIITQKKVPFDIIAGSKKFGIGKDGKGLDGNSHRFRTLGHDPILGYLFGTANIVTNTVTLWDGSSYHIRYQPNAVGVMVPHIYANASTLKMFKAVFDRFNDKNGKMVLTEALVKEHLHLKSDVTTDGLPIPFLQSISPDYAQDLAEFGLDAISLGNIVKQAAYAEFINFIIAGVHSLMCAEVGELDCNLYKVRTRKIILYSNAIASTSNLIAVGIGAAIGNATGNPELVQKSVKYLDIGGLIVTIWHLFSDSRFIAKVKEEFLNSKINPLLEEKIKKIDAYLAE